jgi:hypothetical protein
MPDTMTGEPSSIGPATRASGVSQNSPSAFVALKGASAPSKHATKPPGPAPRSLPDRRTTVAEPTDANPHAPLDTPAPLDAALLYLRRGWSCVPLAPGRKHPPAGFTLAPYLAGVRRFSEGEARAYWTKHPDHGVAIIMGAPSGLIGVDLDPRNGAGLQAEARACPTGLVQQTGGGGLHLFCRYRPDVPKARGLKPGVDIQAQGSYVVAAPSIHPETGDAYHWLQDGEPGDVPAWVLAAQRAAGGGDAGEAGEGTTTPSAAWIIENAETVRAGSQREHLLILTSKLRVAGRSEAEVRSITRDVMDRMPVGDPRDPWDEGHLDELVESAFSNPKFNPPGQVGALVEDADDTSGDGLRFLSYAELGREVAETSQRPWLVPGWLKARGLFMVAGPSHFGKSWLSIDLAVSVATGTPFLGKWPVEVPAGGVGAPVLYIVGEDDAPEFHERLSAILEAKSSHPRVHLEGDPDGPAKCSAAQRRHEAFERNFRVHCDRRFTFGRADAEAALLALVRSTKPALVILDPLKDFVRGEDVEGFFARGVQYTRFLRDLRDAADCCIGLVHHTKKSQSWDAPDAGISGRSEMIASFEHRFVCYTAPRLDGAVRWSRGAIQRRVKGSPPLDPVTIRYAGRNEDDGNGGRCLAELYLEAREVPEADAIALLEDRPDQRAELERWVIDALAQGPCSGRAVETRLRGEGRGVRKVAVLQALKALAEVGTVYREGQEWCLARGGSEGGSQGGSVVPDPIRGTGNHSGEKGPDKKGNPLEEREKTGWFPYLSEGNGTREPPRTLQGTSGTEVVPALPGGNHGGNHLEGDAR